MLDDETTQNSTNESGKTGADQDGAAAPPPRTRRRAAGRPAGPPAAPSIDIFSPPPVTKASETVAAAAAEPEAPAPAAEKPAKKAAKKTAKRAPAKKATKVAAEPTEDAPTDDAPAADAAKDEVAPAVEADTAAKTDTAAESGADEQQPAKKATRSRSRSASRSAGPGLTFQAPETTVLPAAPQRSDDEDDEDEDEQGAENDARSGDDESGSGDSGPKRRRRSRGGRRRNKSEDSEGGGGDGRGEGRGNDQSGDGGGDEESDGQGGTRRRRRRARAGQDPSASPDDPENTVVRVREGRKAEDEIAGVSGSTRLEAKKQRRREGREAGRRRAPIVSESEFLARRESVKREMVVRQRDDYTQIAVLEDSVLVEHYVARESQTSLIGNVYVGKVQNVLPSMEAAFVDIGAGRNAVIYAGEVDWSQVPNGKARKIEDALTPGQSILVQVSKDPIGQKGARLTSQVSLPGRFLVYVPGGQSNGISRKLPDTERARLKTLLKEVLPEDAGVIVRTAAEGATEDQLTRDVAALTARWQDIERKVEAGKAPELLYAEPDLVIKVVRDLFNEDFASLVVEGPDAWDNINGYVSHVAPDLADRLSRWSPEEHDGLDSFAALRVDEQIHKALERKVWLPSGGSLVIDRTEAMTVVDVNTGKFTGSGGNLEETVTKNNLEAAEEIVRQLRLRDIGGIIVIDFIDMVLEGNRDLVLRRLVECLGRDRTRHQVAEVTSLGLVQMTRKRIGTGLLESFSADCDHCKGRGVVITAEPVEPAKDEQRRGRRGGGGRGGDNGGNNNGGGNGSGNGGGEQNGGSTAGGRGRGGRGRGGRGQGGGSAENTSEKASTDAPGQGEQTSSTDAPSAPTSSEPTSSGSAQPELPTDQQPTGSESSPAQPEPSSEKAPEPTQPEVVESVADSAVPPEPESAPDAAPAQVVDDTVEQPVPPVVEDPRPTDDDDGEPPVLTSTGDAP